jgi:hypothetical protein
MNGKTNRSEVVRLAVRQNEEQSEEVYSAQRVKLSIVHTREDVVTIVVTLSEVVDLLKAIRGAIYILVILIAAAVGHYIWP